MILASIRSLCLLFCFLFCYFADDCPLPVIGSAASRSRHQVAATRRSAGAVRHCLTPRLYRVVATQQDSARYADLRALGPVQKVTSRNVARDRRRVTTYDVAVGARKRDVAWTVRVTPDGRRIFAADFTTDAARPTVVAAPPISPFRPRQPRHQEAMSIARRSFGARHRRMRRRAASGRHRECLQWSEAATADRSERTPAAPPGAGPSGIAPPARNGGPNSGPPPVAHSRRRPRDHSAPRPTRCDTVGPSAAPSIDPGATPGGSTPAPPRPPSAAPVFPPGSVTGLGAPRRFRSSRSSRAARCAGCSVSTPTAPSIPSLSARDRVVDFLFATSRARDTTLDTVAFSGQRAPSAHLWAGLDSYSGGSQDR